MFDFDTVVDRRGTGSLKWDKYKNGDVLPMWVADMDFISPRPVLDALVERARHGIFGYSQASQSMTDCIVEMLATKYNWDIDPEWLLWSPGIVPFLNVAHRMIAADEEVLITVPIYPPFLSAPKVADRRFVKVPMARDGARWTFDFDAMAAALTPKTRLFMLCSPYNPLGVSFSRAELDAVVAFCVQHDLYLVSDEIHCELLLDGQTHIPTAALSPEALDRTLTFLAPSKTYNLPGLGASFAVVANPDTRRRFSAAMKGNISEVTAMGYAGCEAAYRHGEPWRLALIDYLRSNRDRVESVVADLPGVSMTHVEATYLAWLNVAELKLEDPVAFFEKAGVGLSDGRFFGVTNHVRLNFGTPRSLLETGLERLAAALADR